MAALPTALSCCCDESEATPTLVPGPQGEPGENGENGADGINAYTTTSAQFTMPSELANVTISVVTSAPFLVGQYLYIKASGASGIFQVVSIPGATSMVVKNLRDADNDAYLENSVATTVFATSAGVSPSGPQGPTGATGDTGVTTVECVANRTALKALTSNAQRLLVFILTPEPGMGRCYRSMFGDSGTADDVSIIEPTDGLARYYEYNLS
jgi:hypothetical protein